MKTDRSRYPFSVSLIVIAGFFLCLQSGPLVGRSQTAKGDIQGVVLRGSTEEPAVGVRVAVYEGAGDYAVTPIQIKTTDGSGTFKLTGLDPGGYSLRFSRE